MRWKNYIFGGRERDERGRKAVAILLFRRSDPTIFRWYRTGKMKNGILRVDDNETDALFCSSSVVFVIIFEIKSTKLGGFRRCGDGFVTNDISYIHSPLCRMIDCARNYLPVLGGWWWGGRWLFSFFPLVFAEDYFGATVVYFVKKKKKKKKEEVKGCDNRNCGDFV